MRRMLLVMLVLGLAACGGDDKAASKCAGPAKSQAGDGLIVKDPANACTQLVIGAKNFDEQFILGEIYAQALRAAGFKVKTQLDLGSEQIAYRALQSNSISAYPEYSGTALTNFYGLKSTDIPSDPQQSYAQLKQDAAKDGITALPQTPFQNPYVVASTRATAQRLGDPETVSALAAKGGSRITISGFPECRQRPDCLLGLKSVYGWTPKFVSSRGKYADLDSGRTDLTFAFGTDGELSTDKYYTYADDKRLFPPYYISLLVGEKGIGALGQAGQDVVAKVQAPLTDEVMQRLNSRVSFDKADPAKVAADYLREHGFIK